MGITCTWMGSRQLYDGLDFLYTVCFEANRCTMVNWLFTLGFPVQTNTDGSFLVVFEVVYVV